MKKYCLDLRVVGRETLSPAHVLLRLTHSAPLPDMQPGQFVELRIDHSPATFLRRPLSINYVDREKNELWLLIHVVGAGTQALYDCSLGDTLNCILPLGRAFTPAKAGERILLVGGGVGVAPLLWLGREAKGVGATPVFLLGARTEKEILEQQLFAETGQLYITTEDGSFGEKGVVTNHTVLSEGGFDRIQVCGPKPMMMAMADYAREKGIDCEVSLENMMACGVGACLCCVEKTRKGHQCVCKDGPIFNTKELLWHV